MQNGFARMLNTSDVAELLGISSRTVCLWAECSESPAIKVGRHWRFRERDMEAWLNARGTNDPAQPPVAIIPSASASINVALKYGTL
jgi:excisionase family DNA binding protein